MNVTELNSLLPTQYFSKLEVIEEGKLFRCKRLYRPTNEGIGNLDSEEDGARVRSVQFFNFLDELPDEDEFNNFQTTILDQAFNNVGDPERWNIFLNLVLDDQNFLISSQDFIQRKFEIEADLAYARKFVLKQSLLKIHFGFVDQLLESEITAEPIFGAWRRILGGTPLQPILDNKPVRSRILDSVLAAQDWPSAHISHPAQEINSATPIEPFGFIDQLNITEFKTGALLRGIKGNFEFGKVNLIYGQNGTSKTSLLEAVEWILCGKTIRNENDSEKVVGEILYKGDTSTTTIQIPSNQKLRERELNWYRHPSPPKSEIRLYDKFWQYNFFNTDRAVKFETDAMRENNLTALASLLAEPEASSTWENIENLKDDIDRLGRKINSDLEKRDSEFTACEERIKALQQQSNLTRASSIQAVKLFQRFFSVQFVKDAQWTFEHFQKESLSIVTLINLIGRFKPTPKNFDEIEEKITQATIDQLSLETTQSASDRLKFDLSNQIKLIEDISKLKRVVEYLDLSRLKGIEQLLEEKSKLDLEVSSLNGKVLSKTRLDELQDLIDSNRESKLSLNETRAEIGQIIKSLAELIAVEELEVEFRRKNLNVKKDVAAQIRVLGNQYALETHDVDACPLCNTRMNKNELLSRMTSAIELGSAEQELNERQLMLSQKKNLMIERKQELTRLELIIKTRPELSNLDLLSVYKQANQETVSLPKKKQEQSALSAKVSEFERDGFTIDMISTKKSEYEELTFDLKLKGVSIENLSQQTNIQEALGSMESVQKVELERLKKAYLDQSTVLESILNRYQKNKPEDAADFIREKLRVLNQTKELLDKLSSTIIDKYRSDIGSLLRDGGELKDAIESWNQYEIIDKANALNLGTDLSRSQEIQKERTALRIQKSNIDRAAALMNDIVDNHGLLPSVKKALASHFNGIKNLFENIHMPKELNLVSQNAGSFGLRRVLGETMQENPINQISTGQRSALALSVFTIQNLALKTAPPYLIFDDPIAHVDDLNTLSFLDFLAELAMTGKRQIFFATANEKLASIFAKKMEFLGEEFKLINMDDKRKENLTN